MTFCNDINVGILMTAFCVFVFVLFFTVWFRFGFTLYKRACLKQTCSFVKPIWNEVSRTKDSILNVSWERNMKHYSLNGN